MGERVDPDLLPGKLRTRVWESGERGSWLFREIGYGTFGVHGWYAYRTGRRWSGAWITTDERAACELIERWMTSATGWREIPAE